MICAACGEHTPGDPCPTCGDPALLDGRYALQALLGQGAFGTTWRAIAPDGATVAIKELPLRKSVTTKSRELLEREARVLRELRHPAIPAWHEHFVTGQGRRRAFCLVQEHVEGVTLAQEAVDRTYAEADMVPLLDELLGILGWLHALRPAVVHRDVKPANVMRRTDGRLALIDFGAVRDAVKGDLGGSTVTGTFGYMAPEQFHGDATFATDLYGAGALAIALLTHREPHTMQDRLGRLQWRGHANVSPELAVFVDSLVAIEPSRRPSSATAARVAVRRIATVRSGLALRARLEPLPPEARAVTAALLRVRETREALHTTIPMAYEEPGLLQLSPHQLLDEITSRLTWSGRSRDESG